MKTFVSICSGIEAASVALVPLGMFPVAFSEIEPKASAFLADRYPDVPNIGDMMALTQQQWQQHPADFVIGGTPCQEFSSMGRWRKQKLPGAGEAERAGVAPRAQLAYRLIDIAAWTGAKAFLWENSPSVLSVRDGQFFAKWLLEVHKRGFVCGWRVLDTNEHFGLPAKRTRLYVVGHRRGPGDWEAIAKALLFGTGDSGNAVSHPAKGSRGEKRADANAGERSVVGFDTASIIPRGSAGTLPTLIAGHAGKYGYVTRDGRICRVTAEETERAMGFPVGYTDAAGLNDLARQMLVGNSFSPVVIQAIVRRLIS